MRYWVCRPNEIAWFAGTGFAVRDLSAWTSQRSRARATRARSGSGTRTGTRSQSFEEGGCSMGSDLFVAVIGN
jgi:hypothetical protein